ncbi:MAG: isoprenylcysteine carboxylmethyltransferase family protein [Undibacterium sp.]|nr:isoprenylcysteine carboxylmethyltransferase family protein [Undibacterium sp.]
MRYLELKIPPLALCAIFAIAIPGLDNFVQSASVPFIGHRIAATALMLLGLTFAIVGVVEFRRAKTTVNPLTPQRATSVVDSGIYRLTRNPMYLGMALMLLAVAVWLSTVLGYALVPLFCVYMTEFQIKPEERALLAIFGQEFSAYMTKVRRWI